MSARQESIDQIGQKIEQAERGDIDSRDSLLVLMTGVAEAMHSIVETSLYAHFGEIRANITDATGAPESFTISAVRSDRGPQMLTMSEATNPFVDKHITVPSTRFIQQLSLNSSQLVGQSSWAYPEWMDVYAERPGGQHSTGDREDFWPFHLPDEASQVGGYCTIFGDLARRLISIAEREE